MRAGLSCHPASKRPSSSPAGALGFCAYLAWCRSASAEIAMPLTLLLVVRRSNRAVEGRDVLHWRRGDVRVGRCGTFALNHRIGWFAAGSIRHRIASMLNLLVFTGVSRSRRSGMRQRRLGAVGSTSVTLASLSSPKNHKASTSAQLPLW
jgi:hypothetical protein